LLGEADQPRRKASGRLAERLRQQPIKPLFLIRTKLHNANHHAKLPCG